MFMATTIFFIQVTTMIMSNYYFFHRGNYYVCGQLLFFIEVTTMIMSNYYFFIGANTPTTSIKVNSTILLFSATLLFRG